MPVTENLLMFLTGWSAFSLEIHYTCRGDSPLHKRVRFCVQVWACMHASRYVKVYTSFCGTYWAPRDITNTQSSTSVCHKYWQTHRGHEVKFNFNRFLLSFKHTPDSVWGPNLLWFVSACYRLKHRFSFWENYCSLCVQCNKRT